MMFNFYEYFFNLFAPLFGVGTQSTTEIGYQIAVWLSNILTLVTIIAIVGFIPFAFCLFYKIFKSWR